MIAAAWIAGIVVIAWSGLALWHAIRLGLSLPQAFAFALLALFARVDASAIGAARRVDAPVLYAVSQQGPLDAALALALLPADTLHILDEGSARSAALEPYRSLARTIAFNARHVFVSRRLVRHLRSGGRLAVYFPSDIEPDPKAFRLYRAVARIAQSAGADIVAIACERAGRWPHAARIAATPARPVEALTDGSERPATTVASALFDGVAESRFWAALRQGSLFDALRQTARRYGPARDVVEDTLSGTLSYRKLLVGARALGRALAARTQAGEAVGIMLPNANGLLATFFGLQSAGRVAAMINYSAGPAAIVSALGTANIRTVVSSRAFIEKAGLDEPARAIEKAGAAIIWLEDVRASLTVFSKLRAAALWRWPLARTNPSDPAVILFTSGSEGTPKAIVLSHRNLLANVGQVEKRIAFTSADLLFNPLPCFHSFGLTGGTLLPLLGGMRLFLYPSPLHFKLIAQACAKVKPTILLGTDTFLASYAKVARDDDFSSLRLVVAGAEPVKAETRRIWRERFGASIVEGYGATEAAPVIAVNSATHGREGAVGRLMPAMRSRTEAVDGIVGAGRLFVSGPNITLGVMTAERPGEIRPTPEGWHDTGDIVALDRDGFIGIAGRAKRFAKVAGEMISLGAVEMLVEALWPEDRHAAIAAPDDRRGERIVLVTTATSADRMQLRAFSKERGYPDLMLPDAIVRADDMPLLGSGKTDYVAVRRLALDKLGYPDAA